jgi:hypothetical protein
MHKGYDSEVGVEVCWTAISLENYSETEIARFRRDIERVTFFSGNSQDLVTVFGSWLDSDKGQFIVITELMTSGNLRT